MAVAAEAILGSPPAEGVTSDASGLLIAAPDAAWTGDAGGRFALAHGAVTVPGTHEPVKYSVSVPETLDSPVVRLIVPGFGGVKRSSRGLRDSLAAQENVAAISLEPARYGGIWRDLLDPQKVHFDTLTAVLQDLPDNKRLAEAPNGNRLDLSQAVLLVQSMGGLAGTERARLYPDETESIVYMGSVGLETRVMFGLVGRVIGSAGHETAGKFVAGKLVPGARRLSLAYQVGRYYTRNPVRTIGEIGSCFQADITRQVRLLGELGVGTAALYFGDDKVVPVTEEIIAATGALVDICEVMEGVGHLAPQRHPAEVAASLGSITRRLEQTHRLDSESALAA